MFPGRHLPVEVEGEEGVDTLDVSAVVPDQDQVLFVVLGPFIIEPDPET